MSEQEVRERINRLKERFKPVLDRLEAQEAEDFKPWVQQYPDAQALYLYLVRPSRRSEGIRTVQVAPSVLLDYDKASGELLGVEILLLDKETS